MFQRNIQGLKIDIECCPLFLLPLQDYSASVHEVSVGNSCTPCHLGNPTRPVQKVQNLVTRSGMHIEDEGSNVHLTGHFQWLVAHAQTATSPAFDVTITWGNSSRNLHELRWYGQQTHNFMPLF